MATTPSFHPIRLHLLSTQKLAGSCGINSSNQNNLRGERLSFFRIKASNNDPSTKKKSVLLCGECEGNGAVACSQCKGTGVNSVDHFNGQFKAGDSCWLCGGKKDMLCGNCQGAGFLGGFMTTSDT